MNFSLRQLAGAVAMAAVALAAAPAHAGNTYTGLFAFGDSLTDTGNVFLASGGAVPTAPYYSGRFSNGPVWIDHLAGGLGLPAGAVPALAGGNNYAFGGARTGTGTSPVPDILAQVGGLWAPAHPAADPNALYVVAGGGNDMRDARSAYQTASAADQAGRQAAAATAAGNIANAVGFLAGNGARHVMIATLPDLGHTPEAAALGLVDASTDASARYNAFVSGIEAQMEGLFAGLDVITFDLAAVADAVYNDALNNGGAVFGITNVFTPCAPFPGNIGISCDVSAFSDALHPSARTHAIVGDAALRAAVPEPAQALLVLTALAGAGFARRRARR